MREASLASAPHFARLEAGDLLSIERQPSQHLLFGLDLAMSAEEADKLAEQPIAWAAFAGDRVLACAGVLETYPGRQGVAWAILAAGIGRRHLAITRFFAWQVAHAGLARIEAIVRGPDIEPLAAAHPEFDPWQLAAAMLAAPTPEMRWAAMMGLRPAAALRRFGGLSESYMLYERLG
jgi:hypothetical protein